jgi:DNA-binding transcriptional MerR regulator
MPHPEPLEIPDKTYFKIGEVAKLIDLEPYVLRYWESEFDILDPDKTDSGQRIYQRDDIELICQIRDLLYNEMFTIAGARRQLELEREGKRCYMSLEDGSDAAAELEAENDQLRERLEQLSARLEEVAEHGDAQPDLWEERIASQTRQIEELEEELSAARETIATLQSERTPAPAGAVDQHLLDGLREHIEGLAELAHRPV